jgi:uncharacterized protein YjbI with pentapeptide repeats
MPRLPQPGSDAGNWGNLLNDFLSTTHDSNGNLKAGSVTTSTLASGSVTLAKLAINNSPTSGQTLTFDGTGLSWSTPTSSGSVPDASTSTKGLVQLAGDLGGTASAPTVPGLAGKANTADVVTLAGSQTVTGAKNFTGGLQSNGTAVVTTGDTRLSDFRTPTDGSVSTAKVADNAITEPKLAAANTPTNGQVLSYNGTNFTWVAQATGSGDPTLGGDLSGVASNAQIATGVVGSTELATNAVTTIKITDANVTTAKLADGAVTEPKLAASNTPTSGQLLSYNGTNFTWVAQPSGTATDPTMGGDLTGTASAAQIVANAVGPTELATNAVTTVKIADANVTTAKIADVNVTTAKIADANVTTAKLADSNVTTAKIADANVTTAKLADASITEPKLSVSNAPASNQVLTWNGTALAWATPAAGGGGGATWNAVTRTTAYTAASGDFVICDTTASGYTITLPAPANGAYVTVKKLTNNVNAVLVAPPSGQINAGSSTSTTISVNNYGQVADFIADGTTWHQVG